MNRDDLPPEVITEIIKVLEWIEANPRGRRADMKELRLVYNKWSGIIRDPPDLLDNLGTHGTVPGLSSYGRLFLLKHRHKPESQSGEDTADVSESIAAKPLRDEARPIQVQASQQQANEPPNELLDELTGQQVKLLKYLWTGSHGVSWDNLPRDAFRGEDNRSDDAVKRALERLQKRLNELYEQFQVGIEIIAETRRVKLDKPSRTDSDNSTDK